MGRAFASFDEPHAWFIRGMIEYGWPDLTRAGGHVPPGAPGGINLSELVETEGRAGLTIEVPAAADGRVVPDDGTYQFQARLVREEDGAWKVVLRCPEANYFQEFPYDPANPLWAAGYVHQALTAYVPEFVRWRLQGGEVSWAQRAGIPDVEGEPCSFLLLNFLRERIQTNRPLTHGPAEGWWLDAPAPPAAPGAAQPGLAQPGAAPDGSQHEVPVAAAWTAGGPVATAGKGSDPTYLSAAAAAEVARLGAQGAAEVAHVQARRIVAAPGAALLTMAGLGMLEGGLLILNAASIVLWYRDRVTGLIVSLVGAALLLLGGLGAVFGALAYKKVKKGPLPWWAMIYAALTPGCCLAGLPIAVWAATVWNRPTVRAARR